MKVLEVEGCRSSVVRALVAKASGPGFESPVTTKIFFTFFLCFFPDPFQSNYKHILLQGVNLSAFGVHVYA